MSVCVSVSPICATNKELNLIRHNIRTKKVKLSIDPSLPTPFLLSKAEEEALALPLSHPLPPKASKNCTLSGALVTTVPLRYLLK